MGSLGKLREFVDIQELDQNREFATEFIAHSRRFCELTVKVELTGELTMELTPELTMELTPELS